MCQAYLKVGRDTLGRPTARLTHPHGPNARGADGPYGAVGSLQARGATLRVGGGGDRPHAPVGAWRGCGAVFAAPRFVRRTTGPDGPVAALSSRLPSPPVGVCGWRSFLVFCGLPRSSEGGGKIFGAKIWGFFFCGAPLPPRGKG